MDTLATPAPAMPASAGERATGRMALLLMALSGFAGLGYQIVWTQQAALWLGHEAAAVFAVVGAFFGGLAVGALALSRRIARSAYPGRWYAACEAVVGAWSLVLVLAMAPVAGTFLALIGPRPSGAWQGFVAFCGTFLLLLPATAAMGATLPAMERALARWRGEDTSIAALYAANTAGAVLGVLGIAFVAIPSLGLARSTAVCAALNLACAALAWRVFPAVGISSSAAPPAPTRRILLLLAATGFLGIGYEVLVVRVVSQVAENTVYTFALLLAVYLVGTAAGAALYLRRRPHADAAIGRDRLLQWLAGACVLGIVALSLAPSLKWAMLRAFGATVPSALAAEAAIAMLAFLLPTVVMGALFSHLAESARAAGIGLGRAIGANTLGAALAPPAIGMLLLAGVGSRLALVCVALGYLALVRTQSWQRTLQWIIAVPAVAFAIWGPSLAVVDVAPGGRIVMHNEGLLAAVAVVEDAGGVGRLHIDNRQQEGSTATGYADARQGVLPLLLHPAPKRALFLGLGTGVTASAAAGDRNVQVDAVELLPEVIAASPYFTRARSDEAARARLTIIPGDARRYVRSTDTTYDVIVSDNFHPARAGSGSLYTVEHFLAVRARLAPDGVFCQWLPLHQLDRATLRPIVRSFLAAFPQGSAILATNSLETPVLGLVGRNSDRRFDRDALARRLGTTAMSQPTAALGLGSELDLFGTFVGGPASLVRFAGDAPPNTDDRPVVAYTAPFVTYAPESRPRDRLLALVGELGIAPEDVVIPTGDAEWEARLRAYLTARDLFLAAGRDVVANPDVRRMVAQVRAPLMGVLRVSPEFAPAYDPLLQMGIALARVDPRAARALLVQLAEVAPGRPEAAQALVGLGLFR